MNLAPATDGDRMPAVRAAAWVYVSGMLSLLIPNVVGFVLPLVYLPAVEVYRAAVETWRPWHQGARAGLAVVLFAAWRLARHSRTRILGPALIGLAAVVLDVARLGRTAGTLPTAALDLAWLGLKVVWILLLLRLDARRWLGAATIALVVIAELLLQLLSLLPPSLLTLALTFAPPSLAWLAMGATLATAWRRARPSA